MQRLDKERVRIAQSPLPPDRVSMAIISRAPVLRGAPAQKKAAPRSNSVGPRAPSAKSELVTSKPSRRVRDTDVGPRFVRDELPKILADARRRGHGAGYMTLSTPIVGFWSILKSYLVKDLNAADRSKLAALDVCGYKYEVTPEMKDAGVHYWRLKVLVQNPL